LKVNEKIMVFFLRFIDKTLRMDICKLCKEFFVEIVLGEVKPMGAIPAGSECQHNAARS
jgi:hypothetical protein